MKKTILWKTLVVITVILLPASALAAKAPDDTQKAKILNKAYRMQVPFIENMGQIENKNVSFYAKTFGGTVFVERNGSLTYSLPCEDKSGIVIKEVFTEKELVVKGVDLSPNMVNYFKDKDKKKWKTNIPSYESVSLGEIYKGIELHLIAYGNNVEKLFIIGNGGNPEDITAKVKGANDLKINKNGELEIITELGSIKFTEPIAYQEIGNKRIEIAVAYNIQESGARSQEFTYKFKVGEYNKNYPLIIDPLLASTFIGGGEGHDIDEGTSIAIDGSGNIYIAGNTSSVNYPSTPGAYDESYEGYGGPSDFDVFVSKLDGNLSSLLASTFIGGGRVDQCNSLVLDGTGNVYVSGTTWSSDYPTTSGAYDENYNDNRDVFVSKLDSSLSSLLASTFIGGGSSEEERSIAVDGSDNVYVTGWTISSDYPKTPGAYNESPDGGYRVFISKLDNNLDSLLASTTFGGCRYDYALFIALDQSGNVYVTGSTCSSDYPTTPGAYDETFNGDQYYCITDVFISKLDSNLSTLLASTFIGGGDKDSRGHSIAIDISGNVYVAGETKSSSYPTTSGAYDQSFNAGGFFGYDIFVSRLDSSLSNIEASTFIGGSEDDRCQSIVTDSNGNVYTTGNTHSSNYPTTPGAYNESFNGGNYDVFVSRLDSSLSNLEASTFIGGSSFEGGNSIAIDGSNVYVTGQTSSSDYPTTSGAYDESFNGGLYDVFVSKLDGDLSVGDMDEDGISDSEDNCLKDHNPGQEDNDTDGLGNACDNCPYDPYNDIDGDDVCGDEDNCPSDNNTDQLNSDNDSFGDVCDNCPEDSNPNQEDTDNDTVGDVCDDCPYDPDKTEPGGCDCGTPDTDTDSDGKEDCIDNCPETPNGPDNGTCVKEVWNIIMPIRVDKHTVKCTDNSKCEIINEESYCQKEQGDINENGVGDACECYADWNNDGIVSTPDLDLFEAEYYQTPCDPTASNPVPPAPGCCRADANNDGIVSTPDLDLFEAQYYHYGCPDLNMCPNVVP